MAITHRSISPHFYTIHSDKIGTDLGLTQWLNSDLFKLLLDLNRPNSGYTHKHPLPDI